MGRNGTLREATRDGVMSKTTCAERATDVSAVAPDVAMPDINGDRCLPRGHPMSSARKSEKRNKGKRPEVAVLRLAAPRVSAPFADVGTKDAPHAPEYVDDRALERLTPIKRVTWQQMRARRTGPRWFKVGRRCLYRLADVRAWIELHVRDD